MHPDISDLPNGSILEHDGKTYVLCNGLDGRIVMDVNGHGGWQFVRGLKWEKFKVLYKPA